MPLTKQQADGLLDGSFTLYVFGKITYRDIFKTWHLTTFCVRLQTQDPLGFVPCDTYNEAN